LAAQQATTIIDADMSLKTKQAHSTTQRKHKTDDSSNSNGSIMMVIMQAIKGCSGDRLILRELLLLPSPLLVICICCILFVVIHNIF
jgi:hypothetical protein